LLYYFLNFFTDIVSFLFYQTRKDSDLTDELGPFIELIPWSIVSLRRVTLFCVSDLAMNLILIRRCHKNRCDNT